MNLLRLWAVARKEVIHIIRDPRSLGMGIAIPMLLLLLFGYALTLDVDDAPLVVWDQSETPASRDLISGFEGSRYFSRRAFVRDYDELEDAIDRGEALVAVMIPVEFGQNRASGRTPTVQILVDGTDSNTAGVVLNYAGAIAARFNERVLATRLTAMGGPRSTPSGAQTVTRAWFNPNLESRNFYVPGVIALIVTLITLMLSSMAVVREKEIGTIEQIMVTPITQVEFILGKTLPFALIAYLDVVLIAGISVFWFDVPIRGSLPLLFVATTLFLMNTIGVGLLISTVSRTQQQAMMSAFFYYFPAILLSGFMFPIANMPLVVQGLTYFNPLRYFLVIIRGVFLKGVGPEVLWTQMAALALLGAASLFVASRKFQKTLA